MSPTRELEPGDCIIQEVGDTIRMVFSIYGVVVINGSLYSRIYGN